MSIESTLFARLCLIVPLLAAMSASAQGAVISDYVLFAVGDSANTANRDAVYAYTSLTASPTLLVDVPAISGQTFGFGNGFASDVAGNRLLWVRDGVNGGEGNDLWSLNLSDLSFNYLGDLGVTGISVNNTSGGGGFYNGSYYYWDDNDGTANGIADDQGLLRVDFNPDGSIAAQTAIYTVDATHPSRGDFGDLTINNAGILYAVSDPPGGGGAFELATLDLSNVGAGFSVIETPVSFQQITFDNLGNLYGVELQSVSGAANRRWYTIDPLTGTSTNILRPVFGAFDFDVYDLSLGAAVPEPGTYAMLGLAAGALWTWRRRKRKSPAGEKP